MSRGNLSLAGFLWLVIAFLVIYPLSILVVESFKIADTGGWGYARWLGEDQTPYGKDASFVQECHGCHTPVKGNDYVFTHPVLLP